MYFSVVCPTDPDGRPERGIEYHEMKMTKLSKELNLRDDFIGNMSYRKGNCTFDKSNSKYGKNSAMSLVSENDTLRLHAFDFFL